MMQLSKDIVRRACKANSDLFGYEFELPLVAGVVDDKRRILSYAKTIGIDGFHSKEVVFMSFNKNTDELRVYAKQQKMVFIIDVKSWTIKKASFLEEFFYAENSNMAK